MQMRLAALSCASAALVAAAAAPAATASPVQAATLVQVRPAAAQLLRAAGAERVSGPLGIWRLRNASPLERVRRARLVSRLEHEGLLLLAERERTLSSFASASYTDPLIPSEWWLGAVGAIDLTPPAGPGKPAVVVDSGLDVAHPEFAGRPDLSVLNRQTTFGREEEHGTEVSSIVGAPNNGVGVTGIYPQAALEIWDASPIGEITSGQAVQGIVRAATMGPSVINLSWGSSDRDPLIERAVDAAVHAGSLVVAAAGNDRGIGSPLVYPASMPHVLTVAATDEQNDVTLFSSSSPAMDLAAPGQDIEVADPTSFDGYSSEDGTSFSAPIVAGAAAWIWTVRPDLDASQLAELLRRTATDLEQPGWDPDTGYGLLNVGAALTAPAPAPDPGEPNDDVRFVRPGGAFGAGAPSLTSVAQPNTTITARLSAADDPRDVYRIWVPAGTSVRATARPSDGGPPLAVSIWGAKTGTVTETTKLRRRDLLGSGAGTASTRAAKAGVGAYVAVAGPTRRTDYALSITTSSAP